MRYPTDSSVPVAQSASHQDAVLAEEEEGALEERRHELTTLLRNLAKIAPEDTTASVHRLLSSLTAAGADPRWQDVEVAVVMLYELGEALVDDVNAAGCGAFREPVTLLMSAGVPHQEHRLVAGAVLECFVSFHSLALPRLNLARMMLISDAAAETSFPVFCFSRYISCTVAAIRSCHSLVNVGKIEGIVQGG